MSLSPSVRENSPELGISNVCRNLEAQFMEDLSKAEGMCVFARVRPMLNSEVEAGYKECIGTVDDQTIRAVVPSSSVKYKSSSYVSQDITEDFKFTAAYGPEVGQFVFFSESMMNTMQSFIEGQNSLVFSYGITGSGKTFTLQGNPDNPGIIPLSLHLFFASIENQLLDRIVVKPDKFSDVNILKDNEIKEEYQIIDQLLSTSNQEEWSFRNPSKKSLAMVLCETFSDKFKSEGVQTTLGFEEMAQSQAAAVMKELSKKSAMQQTGYCSIWVSFVEVYNEYVYDLLQPNINQRTKLTLGEDKNGDVYVKGLREVCVFNSLEALKLLNIGQRNLKIASTKLNYQSSRSHCVFTIKVVRIPDPENITYARVSRLSFCDLAGSERASKSQTTGLRLKEAGCINTSLLVLGRCLEQLRLNPSLRDKKRIPFRESKLTRLLSGFFTGRGKAVMITNASPTEVTFDETLHALRFSALATELIINDSYIATASNTLQTITNMWTNARGNVSTSSDKSISFEDSTVEALQEKDELIEKLLDLAESLTNNLEKEKKEKAELEIKIRRDVCQEYSEYSDELLERQKKNYEEEQESIREIHKKRLAGMEKMYESIIKDLKSEMEDDSSCDEATDCANPDAVNGERKSAVVEKSLKEDIKINTGKEDYKSNYMIETEGFLRDMEALKEDLETVSEELKRTKEELEKSREYCLALESASEDMEKKIEISNLNLEKALTENCELKIKIDYLQASHEDTVRLKEEVDNQSNNTSEFEDIKLQLENTLKINEDIKKELDALKIDCVSYKVDNDDLFKKKSALEKQLKSLMEELEFTKSEKEDLCQKLTDSERNAAHLGEKVNMLSNRENELIKLHDESKADYENSLEEAKNRAKVAEEVLKSVDHTLENALKLSEEQKEKLAVLETECASLREKNTDVHKKKEDLELKYAFAIEELEFEKNKIKSNSIELEKTVKDLDIMKSECLQYEDKIGTIQKTNENLEEKLSSVLKELENEKLKVEKLLKDSNNYEEEICELQKSNKELMDKFSIQASKTESDVLAYKEELDTVNSKLADALSSLDNQKQEIEDLTNAINSAKNEISELQGKNEELMNNINSETESKSLDYKQELDSVNSKLEEALSALNKQEQETENLKNIINSDKKEISLLENQNKELQNIVKDQTESDLQTSKQELDAVNFKLSDALSSLDKQLHEIENLTNDISSGKNEIAELQKRNKELQDCLDNETDCKKELNAVNSKLDEALSALDKQKHEVETLTNVIDSGKKEIAELQNQNKELQDVIQSETESKNTLKQELDSASKRLDEALAAINEKSEELQKMHNECNSFRNKIADLMKIEDELKDKINSQESQTDVLYDLIHVLEKCEFQTAGNMDVVRSDFAKFKDENENLKELLKKNNDDRENEFNTLHRMVQILEKCELFASNKTKELHSSTIKHVEQIMDLEKCITQRDGSIENLKNDYNLLQRQFKDFQTMSKKELQTEKQQWASEIDSIKTAKIATEKENDSLKNQVTQLETMQDKLENEVKKIKTDFEKMLDNQNQDAKKEKLEAGFKSSESELEKIAKENKKALRTSKESKTDSKKLNNPKEKSEKKLRQQSKQKNENEPAEKREEDKSAEKRTSRKAMREPEEAFEEIDKKASKNVKNQGGKKKKSNEKSVVSEDKKLKTVIFEEADENSNSENKMQKLRGSSRKQLRSVENVTSGLCNNKDSISSKSKGSKRKGLDEYSSDKLHEKKVLKKIKLQDIDEIENVSNIKRPQNLRIEILKGAVTTNDIPLPSPRMTRGRKRLCNLKGVISQNKGSPKTVRS